MSGSPSRRMKIGDFLLSRLEEAGVPRTGGEKTSTVSLMSQRRWRRM
jgi:hypothetical protein